MKTSLVEKRGIVEVLAYGFAIHLYILSLKCLIWHLFYYRIETRTGIQGVV